MSCGSAKLSRAGRESARERLAMLASALFFNLAQKKLGRPEFWSGHDPTDPTGSAGPVIPWYLVSLSIKG